MLIQKLLQQQNQQMFGTTDHLQSTMTRQKNDSTAIASTIVIPPTSNP